jgi:hypothetical protein
LTQLRSTAKGGGIEFSFYKESGAAAIESLALEGRSESEARSGERIRASAPLEPQERSYSVKARGREGIMHPKVVQVTIKAEEPELSPSAVREPELRRERGSFGEKDRHGEREPCQNWIDSVSAPSLPVGGEARRYVHARGAGSLKPGERSLWIIIRSAIREAREPVRQRGEARSNRSPKESREERGLLLWQQEPIGVPRELLSAVKATGEKKGGLASLPVTKARSPEEALEEEIPIIKEGQRAASPTGGDRKGDPSSPWEGQTELPTCIRREGTERHRESLLKEPQLCCQSSQARELGANWAQMWIWRESSGKAPVREKMQQSREGKAWAFGNLGIGLSIGKERVYGQAKESQEVSELSREARSSRRGEASEGRESRGSREESGRHQRRRRRKEKSEAAKKKKASPEKRRPKAQALRERRAARPSPKETAERRRAEPPLREKSMKGTARGAASLGEGASEAHFA